MTRTVTIAPNSSLVGFVDQLLDLSGMTSRGVFIASNVQSSTPFYVTGLIFVVELATDDRREIEEGASGIEVKGARLPGCRSRECFCDAGCEPHGWGTYPISAAADLAFRSASPSNNSSRRCA